MADRGGFDDFVAARSPALLGTAYLLTRDWPRAEDLLRAALVRTWRAWPRLHEPPEAYARRIVVDGSGPRRGAAPEGGEAGADPVWEALGRLPYEQRAIVVLRYHEDLTAIEIADLLGVGVAVVESRCEAALGDLGVDRDASGTPPPPVDVTYRGGGRDRRG